jgi:CheY-like chemotaxis protein
VLLVGAPHGGRARLGRTLARSGYQAVFVSDGAEALVRLRRGGFVAVLLADELPGIAGHALLPGIRVAWPEVPVIFVRRPGAAACEAEALAGGAHACLVAPVRAAALLRALREAVLTPGTTGQSPRGGRAERPPLAAEVVRRARVPVLLLGPKADAAAGWGADRTGAAAAPEQTPADDRGVPRGRGGSVSPRGAAPGAARG